MKKLEFEEKFLKEMKDSCLCWKKCTNFKPNNEDNCPISKGILEFDRKYGVITPVWECETFEKGE